MRNLPRLSNGPRQTLCRRPAGISIRVAPTLEAVALYSQVVPAEQGKSHYDFQYQISGSS